MDVAAWMLLALTKRSRHDRGSTDSANCGCYPRGHAGWQQLTPMCRLQWCMLVQRDVQVTPMCRLPCGSACCAGNAQRDQQDLKPTTQTSLAAMI